MLKHTSIMLNFDTYDTLKYFLADYGLETLSAFVNGVLYYILTGKNYRKTYKVDKLFADVIAGKSTSPMAVKSHINESRRREAFDRYMTEVWEDYYVYKFIEDAGGLTVYRAKNKDHRESIQSGFRDHSGYVLTDSETWDYIVDWYNSIPREVIDRIWGNIIDNRNAERCLADGDEQ